MGLNNNFSYWELYFTDIGELLPNPTDRFGFTFILTTSLIANPWVVVLAAATFVITVEVILSISPVTCSNCEDIEYNPEEIPDEDPPPLKYTPSLVLPIDDLWVTNPI